MAVVEAIEDDAVSRELSAANVGAVDANSDGIIPTIDMSAARDDIIDQMWMAAQTVGFFNVVNHGISEEDIDVIFQMSKDFFARSSDDKRQYPFDTARNSGYEYFTQAPPSTKTVDQKESMQITAREGCMDGLWPSSPGNFRSTMEDMMVSLHRLACTILSLLEAKACPHLKPGTLANAHNLWNEGGQCTLRLMHYPPCNEELIAERSNLWRAGAHTDWGCVTLLFQRMGEDGLECRHRGGAWIEVPPVQGGITVNVGDMLKRWSDEVLMSNMHRVRMPRTIEECQKSRYSVAFFLQADKSALIECKTKEAITAGDYFARRINSHFAE